MAEEKKDEQVKAEEKKPEEPIKAEDTPKEEEAPPKEVKAEEAPAVETPKEEEAPAKEVKTEEPPAEAPKKVEAAAVEQPVVSPAETAKEPAKKKKINKMTLSEIDAKLVSVKEHMGNFDSKYAQELLKRKSFLSTPNS